MVAQLEKTWATVFFYVFLIDKDEKNVIINIKEKMCFCADIFGISDAAMMKGGAPYDN